MDDALEARQQTEQREEELRRLNRILEARSNSSQALVRARDESSFLQEVCRIVVEDCGHTMVWVGIADEDEPSPSVLSLMPVSRKAILNL